MSRLNRTAVTLAAAALPLLALTPASAATGDYVWTNTSTNTELKTDACAGAWVLTNLEGGPPPNPVDITVHMKGGYSGCVLRSRLNYVKNGIHYVGEYYTTVYGTNSGLYAKTGVSVRCWTEVGLRRKDGTWLTRKQYNTSRPSYCGS